MGEQDGRQTAEHQTHVLVKGLDGGGRHGRRVVVWGKSEDVVGSSASGVLGQLDVLPCRLGADGTGDDQTGVAHTRKGFLGNAEELRISDVRRLV